VGAGADAGDVLRSFFGGGPAPASAAPRTRQYRLPLTLGEIYSGTVRRVTLPPRRTTASFRHPLYGMLHRPGPVEPGKEVEVPIPAGSAEGERITLHGVDGSGDDVEFLIECVPHDIYRRVGKYGLCASVVLRPSESLCPCGAKFVADHVDGMGIAVTFDAAPDEAAEEGSVWVVEGMGMPVQPGERWRAGGRYHGDLFLVVQLSDAAGRGGRMGSPPTSLPATGRPAGPSPIDEALGRISEEERKELVRLMKKMEGPVEESNEKLKDGGERPTAVRLRRATAKEIEAALSDQRGEEGRGEEDESGGREDDPFRGSQRFGQQSNPFEGIFGGMGGGRTQYHSWSNSAGGQTHEDAGVQCQQM